MNKTNFWKIENSEVVPLNVGTKTIQETTAFTPKGAYTTFRTYNRTGVLRLSKHLDRLEETARLAGYDICLDREKLLCFLAERITESAPGEKRIRITVDLEKSVGTIYIAMEPLSTPAPELYRSGIVCRTTETHRENPKAKLSSFLERAAEIRSQENKNVDEVIMYDSSGNLLEGLSSNFFGIRGDVIYTAEEGVLSGTTRDFILKLADELEIPVIFQPVNRKDIHLLDEAFISSTSRSILPIREIDGIYMNQSVPGPVTRSLMEQFSKKIESGIEYLTN